jgi:hypothetical protein
MPVGEWTKELPSKAGWYFIIIDNYKGKKIERNFVVREVFIHEKLGPCGIVGTKIFQPYNKVDTAIKLYFSGPIFPPPLPVVAGGLIVPKV